jgi:hypothetical protein
VLYAAGALDPSQPGGLVASEMPSGQMLGRFADIRRQGGGFAVAGDPLRCVPSCVNFQRLHVTADGTRLFVRAAPGQPELRSRGLATVVWVVDTVTLSVVAEVPLPAPAFDAAPTPDGAAVITSNTLNTPDAGERATQLVEIPTGRELARWSGAVSGMQTQPPASALSPAP